MSATIYIDAPTGFLGISGAYGAAIPNGQPLITFPLQSENNYARVYVQSFVVNSGADQTATLGTAGLFPNTYLVAESDRQALGGGFVEFNRSYSEIPSGFDDYQTTTYTFPALATPLVSYRDNPKTLTVVARVHHDFFLTGNPQGITLSGAQRYINSGGWDVTTLGLGSNNTNPNITTYSGWVANGTEIITEDASLTRYVGPIWRRQTVYIKAK